MDWPERSNMKKIIFLIMLSVSTLAYSKNSIYCTQIVNQDLKNFCYAMASNGNCVMINDSDSRNFCYSLTQNVDTCVLISNNDMRNFCYALK